MLLVHVLFVVIAGSLFIHVHFKSGEPFSYAYGDYHKGRKFKGLNFCGMHDFMGLFLCGIVCTDYVNTSLFMDWKTHVYDFHENL